VIIWGTRTKREPAGFVLRDCRRCGSETVHFAAQSKTKFTLYFVPTFTTSTKALLICTRCELQVEVGGGEGQALLARALPQEAMLAFIEGRQGGSERSAPELSPSRAMAIATVALAMAAAGADGRVEDNEAAAVGYALNTISGATQSTPVREAAQLASTELGPIVEYVVSPVTEPLPVMFARAGAVARELPDADRKRYVGQLSWLCHAISSSGSGSKDLALHAMDGALEQMGFTPREISEALAFCQSSGG
jgi:hypothetical protein